MGVNISCLVNIENSSVPGIITSSERLSNLFKVTKLVCGRGQIHIQFWLAPKLPLFLSLVFLAVSQIVFFFIFKNKAVSSENQTQCAESC